MSRSKCVICGKKRKRDFLIKINGNWLCNKSTNRFSFNYIDLSDKRFSVIPCQIKYIESLYFVLFEVESKILAALKSQYYINSSVLDDKVRPERTFKLQLDKINFK